MSSTAENLHCNFIKPGISALVGGVLLQNEQMGDFVVNTTIPGLARLNGTTLNRFQFGAMIGLTSSFLVESLNNIIHEVDKANRTKHFASFITHTAGGMFFWNLIPYILSSKTADTMYNPKLAKIGFVSELGSQWVHENFVEAGSFGQDVLDIL